MDSALHARIKAIFLQACDLESGARAAFIDESCGSDVALRDADPEHFRPLWAFADAPPSKELADYLTKARIVSIWYH